MHNEVSKEYCADVDWPTTDAKIQKAQLDLLNWVMQVCGSGMTPGMIRKVVYNKYVEISGEGEKA